MLVYLHDINQEEELDPIHKSRSVTDMRIVDSDTLFDAYEIDDTIKLLSVFDTGGQPEYINLLPAINSVPDINFIVHDLTKELDDVVLVRYNRTGCEEEPRYTLHYTNLDMIELLVCLITDSLEQRIVQLPRCIGKPEESHIDFIGTHYDMVKDDQEKLQKINKRLSCRVDVVIMSHLI